MSTVGIHLEFPASAFALLLAIAIQGGHGSVEQMLHALALGEVRAFCAAVADEADPTAAQIFTLNRP